MDYVKTFESENTRDGYWLYNRCLDNEDTKNMGLCNGVVSKWWGIIVKSKSSPRKM